MQNRRTAESSKCSFFLFSKKCISFFVFLTVISEIIFISRAMSFKLNVDLNVRVKTFIK